MSLKSFYYQYGYKEFISKESLDENIHLRRNNFHLHQLNIFLPVFESKSAKKVKKHTRSKLNKIFILYFLYQLFFDKNLKVIFKESLGITRKILKKRESPFQDVVGFRAVLNSTEAFEFLENLIYDFFFKSLYEKNDSSSLNIRFRQGRLKQNENILVKFNLNTFFDLHIFFLLKDELSLDSLEKSDFNFYFKTRSLSRKINCLRFMHFPLEYKKINRNH